MAYSIEEIKWLPKWMACYNIPNSGSALAQFLINTWISFYPGLVADINNYSGNLLYNGWGQPHTCWIIYPNSNVYIDIVLTTPFVSGNITRAVNMYDFSHALTPIFIYLDDGSILIRNLEVIQVNTTPASDYSVNIPDRVIDTNVWYLSGRAYEKIKVGSHNIVGSIVYFPQILPLTILYNSQSIINAIDASGTVAINGGPNIKLTRVDIVNGWDSTGTLFDLQRLQNEDNINYYNRQKSWGYFRGGTQQKKLEVEVSRQLNLISSITWAASSELNFNSLGLYDVVEVNIDTINQLNAITETTIEISPYQFLTSKIPNVGTILVSTSNIITAPASASLNNVYFSVPPTTSVQATYSYNTYNINRDASGFIVSVYAASGNLNTNKTYLVYFCRGVQVHTLNSQEYYQNLFNPDGSGKNLLTTLGKTINQMARDTLGYCVWGSVQWLTDSDEKPEMNYINRILE